MNAGLTDALNRLLRERRLSVAVAESLTCGRLQTALGAVSGSSEFFLGGITAYSLRHKIALLGVDPGHAASVNCVSQRVAFEMAAGACLLFDSDLGLGTTGYAEPCPAAAVMQPTAFFGLCRRQDGKMLHIAGSRVAGPGLNRREMQERVCETALLALLDYLQTGD
ncbi:MAG: CinA family protein [Methylococcales bacterium]|nr:CinA family protein [Methylococcales bacterium]